MDNAESWAVQWLCSFCGKNHIVGPFESKEDAERAAKEWNEAEYAGGALHSVVPYVRPSESLPDAPESTEMG
jgi:hypothetical protein